MPTKRRVATSSEVTLPNGLVVEAPNRGEATFLYEEIFGRGTYLRHGIDLADGATVLDVGANIGLFAVSLAQRHARLRLLLFEPVPSTFAMLQRNAARVLTDADVTLCCAGMAAAPGRALLDVDPRWSLDAGLDNRELGRTARNRAGVEAWTHALVHDAEQSGRLSATRAAGVRRALRNPVARPALLAIVAAAGRLRTAQRRRENRRVPCEMTTLSAALRDHEVDAVDLVKIDVEGGEWEVLRGIEDSDWSRVRQLVIEVHDIAGRLARMTDLLRSKGYVVTTEQDDWALLRLMGVSMLYARRP